MKESEFYRRAATDAAFRRAKLEDLRYYRNVGAGVTWFCIVAAAAFSIYGGFADGNWMEGNALLFVAALTGSTWTTCRTRIAALEEFEARAGH